MVDFTTIFAGVAVAISILNLYLYSTQVKAGKPKIDFVVSNGQYTMMGDPAIKETKSDIRVTCAVLFRNTGNASGSVNDVKLRMRYYSGLRTHPLGGKLLGRGAISLGGRLKQAGVLSDRPTNFDTSIPIHVEPYGTSKALFVFDFSDVYPYFLDRATGPIDPDHPDHRTEWQDEPVLVEISAATTNGTAEVGDLLYRSDQPKSKESSGFMNQWDAINKDIKFVDLDEKSN